MNRTLEQRTMAKISWRLLPLIVVIYFVAYIDRTNVGFAASGMNKALRTQSKLGETMLAFDRAFEHAMRPQAKHDVAMKMLAKQEARR